MIWHSVEETFVLTVKSYSPWENKGVDESSLFGGLQEAIAEASASKVSLSSSGGMPAFQSLLVNGVFYEDLQRWWSAK